MFVRHGSGDVDHREKHKNISLHESHKQVQPHKDRRNHEISEAEENHRHFLACVHVSEQTNGERKGTSQMAHNFDRDHQRSEPPEGPNKMGSISSAVRLDPHQVVVEEGGNSATKRHHWIHRRRFESWNQANEIGKKDEQKDRAKITEILDATVSHLILGLSMDKLVDQLEDVLQFARLVGGKPSAQHRKQQRQYRHDQNLHDDEIRQRTRLVWQAYHRQEPVAGRGQVVIKDLRQPQLSLL